MNFRWSKKNSLFKSLRPPVLVGFLVIILLISSFLFVAFNQNVQQLLAAVVSGVLSDLTNNQRQNYHLTTLKISPLLDKAAQEKVNDMARRGYFSHISPDGKKPWYWLDLVGYKYRYAGENLAMDFSESEEVIKAWMDSLGHRENIVKKNYTEIGSGVATGTYQGKIVVYAVQFYASPEEKGDFYQSEIITVSPGSKVLGASIAPIFDISKKWLYLIIALLVVGGLVILMVKFVGWSIRLLVHLGIISLFSVGLFLGIKFLINKYPISPVLDHSLFEFSRTKIDQSN
jgi:hypothetical protein